MSSNNSVNTAVRPRHSRAILDLAARYADKQGTVWLDSSLRTSTKGKYSYLAHDPYLSLVLRKDSIEIPQRQVRIKSGALGSFLNKAEAIVRTEHCFAAGFISYEASLPLIGVDSGHVCDDLPLAQFNFYREFNVLDHDSPESKDADHVMSVQQPRTSSHVDDLETAVDSTAACLKTETSRHDYFGKVRQIKKHIHEGDIYQANLTNRFEVSSSAHPLSVYNRLRVLNPSPYGAFMNLGDWCILSSSPERLVDRKGVDVLTTPIKGTIARGDSLEEERINMMKLLNSEKDRAELLMIVDLERNDLGTVAIPGSVTVKRIFTPEVYPGVIHLEADISAEVPRHMGHTAVLKALLPGGSITGAPKKRAVEILDRLETTARHVYTGCIGYMYGEEMSFSLAIRTIYCRNQTYFIHAGGGIVADSTPEGEWDEMHLKARKMFAALGLLT